MLICLTENYLGLVSQIVWTSVTIETNSIIISMQKCEGTELAALHASYSNYLRPSVMHEESPQSYHQDQRH